MKIEYKCSVLCGRTKVIIVRKEQHPITNKMELPYLPITQGECPCGKGLLVRVT